MYKIRKNQPWQGILHYFQNNDVQHTNTNTVNRAYICQKLGSVLEDKLFSENSEQFQFKGLVTSRTEYKYNAHPL